MNRDKFNEIIFSIISQSGEAKAMFLEALNLAEENQFVKAQEMLKQGKKALASLHHEHFDLISHEAKGESLEITLLLVHAEDQFMSAETTLTFVEKLILLYKKINDKK